MRFTHLLIASLPTILVTPSFCPAEAPSANSSLAGMYQAVGAEDYVKAKALCDTLLKTAAPAERLTLSLSYGRILLGLGLKEPARAYLAMMAKQELDGDGQTLMEVYAAWLGAQDGKFDAGITALEKILQSDSKTVVTAEAADVLALMYLERGDTADAKRAVDFGLAVVQYVKTPGVRTDYIEALLRGRLNNDDPSSEAEKLYQAAEALRQQGKFAEAGKGFTEIVQKHPRTEWAPQASVQIGHCLVGLNRSQDAIGHWKRFVDSKQAGPWRAQAYVASVDTILLTTQDLRTASALTLAATSILGKPLQRCREVVARGSLRDPRPARHGFAPGSQVRRGRTSI
jgi:tetratricopeptide (TPR) repeat protein